MTPTFRDKIGDVLADAHQESISYYEATDKIIALCKEMLVPGEQEVNVPLGNRDDDSHGWNACRTEMLKILGGEA